MTITNKTQEFVRKRANFQCEYCHYPELLSTSPLTIDHIYPQSLGGSDNVVDTPRPEGAGILKTLQP